MPEMWTAGKYMTCHYVQSTPWGTSSGALLVHCPALMPMIGMGRPKVTPTPLNKSIFRNASDCAIAVPSQISTQNYLTAMAPLSPFEEPHYDYGSVIEVEPLDQFMQRSRITLNVDNSTDHYR